MEPASTRRYNGSTRLDIAGFLPGETALDFGEGGLTTYNEGDTVKRRSSESPSVIVIDDDPDVREGLGRLLRSVGFQYRLLCSVDEFFKMDLPEGPSCLVLDVRMPGRSGLDLQRELARGSKRQLPIIFITGHGDIPMTVQAMKGGAIEFLMKPFRDQDLLDAIALGHERDRHHLENEEELSELQLRYQTLSPREREVMSYVVAGRLNKQIAADLAIREITVKVHRGQVMRKMRASSLPELARMSDKLRLPLPDTSPKVGTLAAGYLRQGSRHLSPELVNAQDRPTRGPKS